jgi:hypothetical protein
MRRLKAPLFGGTAIRDKAFSIACLACVLGVNEAQADATACKAFADSLIKSSVTPYHSISMIKAATDTAGSDANNQKTTSTSETIFTGAAIFVRFGSENWQKMPVPLDKLHDMARQNAEGFTDCEQLNDQIRNGQSVSVYTGHHVSKQTVTAMQLWVAKGLPVESSTDVVEVSGTRSTLLRHVATRYDYEKIAAPVIAP